MFPIGVRVVNGNMINNYTNSKFPSPIHHRPCSPSPCPVTLEYFGSSSTAASGCVAVSVSPPTSFFWPWRVSAPELESTLSTLSCDIRPSSSSCRLCSETNKKSPVRSKSISQILRSRPRDRDTAQHQNLAAGLTQRGNLFLTQRLDRGKEGWPVASFEECMLFNSGIVGKHLMCYHCTDRFFYHNIFQASEHPLVFVVLGEKLQSGNRLSQIKPCDEGPEIPFTCGSRKNVLVLTDIWRGQCFQ